VRYLILSDMHGNWEAFSAVLRHAEGQSFDATLVLGDLVGYGASPNEVVEAVRELPELLIVRGNHDKVVAGIDLGENFNHVALSAARWTTGCLREENMRYVEELPQGPRLIADGLAICHGSPLDEDAYVFSEQDAVEIFAVHSLPLTFFGHTHVPSLFALGSRGLEIRALRGDGALDLAPEGRYLLNPGSIGQPRDRDPRAAYMTYDDASRAIRWHRVAYPVAEAQRRIREAGLPPILADRLAVGI
jgi:predicted phosphodiesterase